jgi:hypothetical protein
VYDRCKGERQETNTEKDCISTFSLSEDCNLSKGKDVHMKLFARMNHIICISTIAVILCVALTGGSPIYKHDTAHACGSSIIPASTTTFHFIDYDNHNIFVTIIFSLWYNSCNGQNFTSANIVGGSYSVLKVFVDRNSGPDGGAIGAGNSGNCPSTGICNSLGVYSPDNTAYATITLDNGDIISTGSF